MAFVKASNTFPASDLNYVLNCHGDGVPCGGRFVDSQMLHLAVFIPGNASHGVKVSFSDIVGIDAGL